MEIKDTDYILCFAIGNSAPKRENGKTSDFLLSCLKRDNEWLVEYRFRYHKDNKVFDSEDKKSFYNISLIDKPEEYIISTLNQFIEVVRVKYPDTELTLVQGDTDKFMYMFAQEENCNIQRKD